MSTQKVQATSGASVVTASKAPMTSSKARLRRRAMIQNYLLIWVDAAIDQNNEECQNALCKLQEVVKEIKICTEPTKCIEYINDMDRGKAFIISSGSLGQHLVSQIHDMSQVDAIYIFCSDKTRHEQWAKEYTKIEGVYISIDPICESLRKVANLCDHDAAAMSFLPKRTTTSAEKEQNIDELEPSYMYTMLFKDIILEIEEDDRKSVKDLVTYCRDKGIPELELNTFQSKYRQKSAIWWYTCEIFLYSMLNKSLRDLDMGMMVKMGFIIRKLHRELQKLHREQSKQFEQPFIVYRGQSLTPEDFQHLHEIKGGLLAFNCFLSTSTTRDVAMEFMERNLQKYKENVGVLFIMTIDPSKFKPSKTPFAMIDKQSAVPTENEILFSMHAVFRVIDLKQSDKNKRQCEAQLMITDDDDPQLSGLTKYMKDDLRGKGWIRMGDLMRRVGDFDQAEELYHQLLEDSKNDGERARIYQMLGMLKNSQGKYEEAITFYEKCLHIERKTVKEDDPSLAPTYNNIALTYNNMNEHSKALGYYEKALKIKEKSLAPAHPSLATSYNNIGVVYNSMGDHLKALEYYEKALKIKEKVLPPTHPDLATSYSNIGLVYNNIGDHSKALEYYEKGLKIDEKALPPTHPSLATSYNNIGQVYNKLGDHSKAVEYYEKTLKIDEKSLPPTHLSLALSYSNVGMAYSGKQDYPKALSFLEKALRIRQKVLPTTHPLIQETIDNINYVKKRM